MKKNEWKKIKVVKNTGHLKIGDLFLYGENISRQKDKKKPGQEITYYKIIEKKENSVEYIPVYDILEED